MVACVPPLGTERTLCKTFQRTNGSLGIFPLERICSSQKSQWEHPTAWSHQSRLRKISAFLWNRSLLWVHLALWGLILSLRNRVWICDSEGPLRSRNKNKVFDAFETFVDAPLEEQLLSQSFWRTRFPLEFSSLNLPSLYKNLWEHIEGAYLMPHCSFFVINHLPKFINYNYLK